MKASTWPNRQLARLAEWLSVMGGPAAGDHMLHWTLASRPQLESNGRAAVSVARVGVGRGASGKHCNEGFQAPRIRPQCHVCLRLEATAEWRHATIPVANCRLTGTSMRKRHDRHQL